MYEPTRYSRHEYATQLATALTGFMQAIRQLTNEQVQLMQTAGFVSDVGKAQFEEALKRTVTQNIEMAGETAKQIGTLSGEPPRISLLGRTGIFSSMAFDREAGAYQLGIMWEPVRPTQPLSTIPLTELIEVHT